MRDVVDPQTGEVIQGRDSSWDLIAFEHAFLECQKDLPAVIGKDAKNPHLKSRFTSLPKIVTIVKPILNNHGFSYSQGCCFSAFTETSTRCAYIDVYTDITHAETGLAKRAKLPVPMQKLDAQAAGSALKYGRRYTFLAALGIADGDEDDDGQAAMPRQITEDVNESPELAKLKQEMAKIKHATDLVAWAGEQKIKSRINGLSEGEAEMLRFAFRSLRDRLVKEAQEA